MLAWLFASWRFHRMLNSKDVSFKDVYKESFNAVGDLVEEEEAPVPIPRKSTIKPGTTPITPRTPIQHEEPVALPPPLAINNNTADQLNQPQIHYSRHYQQQQEAPMITISAAENNQQAAPTNSQAAPLDALGISNEKVVNP